LIAEPRQQAPADLHLGTSRNRVVAHEATSESVSVALLELVAAQPSDRTEVRSGDEGRQQRGLADARFALHDDDLRAPRACAGSSLDQDGELRVTPADQGPVVGYIAYAPLHDYALSRDVDQISLVVAPERHSSGGFP
jgi:hypothetical protein